MTVPPERNSGANFSEGVQIRAMFLSNLAAIVITLGKTGMGNQHEYLPTWDGNTLTTIGTTPFLITHGVLAVGLPLAYYFVCKPNRENNLSIPMDIFMGALNVFTTYNATADLVTATQHV